MTEEKLARVQLGNKKRKLKELTTELLLNFDVDKEVLTKLTEAIRKLETELGLWYCVNDDKFIEIKECD